MSEDQGSERLRDRISQQGEDTLGKIAHELVENPILRGAISRAFSAREKALSAQQATLTALNLPSAGDIDRVARRIRSLTYRLEGIEDGVDRLGRRLAKISQSDIRADEEERLSKIETSLEEISAALRDLFIKMDGIQGSLDGSQSVSTKGRSPAKKKKASAPKK